MDGSKKRLLLRLCAAALLFAAAFFVPVSEEFRLFCFLPAYFVAGYEVLWEALKNLIHGGFFDENFLMTIASGGAFLVGEYPEAVTVMLLYEIGEFLQNLAVGKSRSAVTALLALRPDHARVLRNQKALLVAPTDVAAGEIIRVDPGERVPLDGVIVSGFTAVNTAALTGESLPRSLAPGDTILSGTVNLSASVTVRVSGVYAESTVAKLLELMEHAASKKAKTEAFITRFARVYTPAVVGAAVALAILPPLCFGGVWIEWVRRALTFLVVSCPCALVLSIPMTFFGGIGGASRRGILIKGADSIERLARVSTCVFDKTGTLTQGTFSVTAIHPNEMDAASLIDIAALSESHSSHPIATSIIRAHGGHIDESRIGSITEYAGRGIKAIIDGATVFAGNGALMKEAGVSFHECHKVGTVVHVARDGRYCGHIVISDTVKESSAQAIRDLRALGIRKTVLLTGDSEAVAANLGRELALSETHANLSPAEKVAFFETLLPTEPGAVAFVGDGINDAPVLARADVGISMGALGSDAAIESADVVLMDDDPARVALAIRISRRTMRIARENIAFSLAVKAIVLGFGAFGLVSMWVGVFADVGVSLIAVANALRALRNRK